MTERHARALGDNLGAARGTEHVFSPAAMTEAQALALGYTWPSRSPIRGDTSASAAAS